ncbi:hypothetical protein [Hamadaea tsunoensis]|uniref:hypothetical protein n=1 Tax=Hamadaea tsunoensis TaxID=53368 RepID=UPI0003F64501|nr:hypothetical protein [Hamadaea tsunoensis]
MSSPSTDADGLLLAYWHTLNLARRTWNSHHEIGLQLDGRRAIMLPDGRNVEVTLGRISPVAEEISLKHQPVPCSGRPDFAAYCTGCAPAFDYRQCQHAGWLRCWRLWEAFAINESALRHSGLAEHDASADDRLNVAIALAEPIGIVTLSIDRDGTVTSPSEFFFRADLLRAELRRVHLLHIPIGPAVAPAPAVGPQRLCHECVRGEQPVQYYDRCAWRRFARAWAGAPRWLWNCIGQPCRAWPKLAKVRYNQEITTPVAALGRYRPNISRRAADPARALTEPAGSRG